MPRFGTLQAGGVFTCLSPGTSVNLINESIPGDGSFYLSNPVSLGLAPSGDVAGFSVFVEWGATPVGSTAIGLYGSNSNNQPLTVNDFVSIGAIGAALARTAAFPISTTACASFKYKFIAVGFGCPSAANSLAVTIQA